VFGIVDVVKESGPIFVCPVAPEDFENYSTRTKWHSLGSRFRDFGAALGDVFLNPGQGQPWTATKDTAKDMFHTVTGLVKKAVSPLAALEALCQPVVRDSMSNESWPDVEFTWRSDDDEEEYVHPVCTGPFRALPYHLDEYFNSHKHNIPWKVIFFLMGHFDAETQFNRALWIAKKKKVPDAAKLHLFSHPASVRIMANRWLALVATTKDAGHRMKNIIGAWMTPDSKRRVRLGLAADEWGAMDVWKRIGRAFGILGGVAADFFDLGDWIRRMREQAGVFKAHLVLNVLDEVDDLDTRLPNFKTDEFISQKVFNAKYSVLVSRLVDNVVRTSNETNLASFNLSALAESPERASQSTYLARSRNHFVTDSALLVVSSHGVNPTTPEADKYQRLLSSTRSLLSSPESHLAFLRENPISHDVYVLQSMHLKQDPHARLTSEPLVK
jgi:hypothetical protein